MKKIKDQKEKALQEAIESAYDVDCSEGNPGYRVSAYIQDGKVREDIQKAIEDDNIDIEEFVKLL